MPTSSQETQPKKYAVTRHTVCGNSKEDSSEGGLAFECLQKVTLGDNLITVFKEVSLHDTVHN